jgi:arylsulfatase A-like enzyme
MRAQYYGMISEVDAQLARVWAALEARGDWDRTLIVVTSDHGEQLGDHGLKEKGGFYESSYAIVGIVRDPNGARGVLDEFTENVDIMPTLCEAMGVDVPLQCDGLPLTPFLHGERPPHWRDAAHYEYDWRSVFIATGDHPWPWDRRLERQNLAVRRSRDRAFVHFGDGSWLCFDLAADPTWHTQLGDPDVVLAEATAMLSWRSRHLDRTMTGMLLENGGIGRYPPAVRTVVDQRSVRR